MQKSASETWKFSDFGAVDAYNALVALADRLEDQLQNVLQELSSIDHQSPELLDLDDLDDDDEDSEHEEEGRVLIGDNWASLFPLDGTVISSTLSFDNMGAAFSMAHTWDASGEVDEDSLYLECLCAAHNLVGVYLEQTYPDQPIAIH